MLPRNPPTPRDKREELQTYSELKLRRDLKSKIKRRRLEANGAQRVLGNGSSGQPYLVVETRRYRQVRLEIQRRLLVQARETGLHLPVDVLLGQLEPRIEALAYEQLAKECDHTIAHNLPVAALGRSLTKEEQTHFAASRAAAETVAPAEDNRQARSALNQVLGSIEKRQTHNPERYQTIWAQLVGPDAAQQSHLEPIDLATQTAFFRCFNSVLSADIQRRPGLTAKLARALGMPIRKLRARF